LGQFIGQRHNSREYPSKMATAQEHRSLRRFRSRTWRDTQGDEPIRVLIGANLCYGFENWHCRGEQFHTFLREGGAMYSRLILWVFVIAVTVLDVGYAWQYRRTFTEWELNPIASHFATAIGLQAVIAFRIFGVVLGLIAMNFARKQMRDISTAVVFLIHLALLLIYAHGYLQ
jgi:hypothetical protein